MPFACALARADGACVTVLHVLESHAHGDDQNPMDALDWEIHRAEAERYLRRVVEAAGDQDVVVHTRIVEGLAHERIASLSAELGEALLIMTTHGAGDGAGDGHGRLGGTVQKTLELASCPVLSVPVGADDSGEGVPRRILVPLDGSVRSLHVLPTALRLARSFSAEVVLATVVKSPVRTELLSRDDDFELAHELSNRLACQAESYLGGIKAQLEANGVNTVTRVRHDADHRAGLVEIARTEGTQLTVMSAHGSACNPRRRYGTVPSYFMAHADAPVLVLQDLPRVTRRHARRSTRLPSRSFDAVAGGA